MMLAAGACLAPKTTFADQISLKNAMNPDESTASYREARYYQSTPRGVKCLICPNECTLKEGELSDCRNRIAKDGKLYTMAYGNPCAMHVDPVEKKPLLHFLPGTFTFSLATAGCNFACLNCQNWEISQKSPTETKNFEAPPDALVATAKAQSCESISYTYSEPVTFFEYMYDTARAAKKQGLRNILVSNGYINPEPLRDLCQYTDAANIDLKTFDPDVYLKLTGGKLEPVVETLKILRDQGVWLEITNLVIPNWTDNLETIQRMCQWLADEGFAAYPLHFSRFHPQHKLTRLPATPLQTLTSARQIAQKAGLQYVYIGNVPGTGGEDTWCPECKKLVVRRNGYMITENHLKKGACSHCSHPIPGVWSN